jgi:hypothetical protein
LAQIVVKVAIKKQTDLLYSLALYADKTKDKAAMKISLDELQVLMPNNPQVQQWLQKYGQ